MYYFAGILYFVSGIHPGKIRMSTFLRSMTGSLKLLTLGILILFMGNCVPAVGAVAVFVNAPRQIWPKEKISFGTELRFRYENLNNFNITGYGNNVPAGKQNDSIYLGRIRIGINYSLSDKVRFSLWGYQSSSWDLSVPRKAFYNPKFGQEDCPYEDRSEIYKGFVEFRTTSGPQLKLKLGRQRLDYGDFRTFGLCNWTNSGPYLWDAAKVSYDFGKDNFIDAFYGRIKINDPKNFSLNHRHSYDGAGLYSRFSLSILKAHFEPFLAYKGDNTDKYKGENGHFGDLDEYYAGARIWGRDFYRFDYDIWFSREFGEKSNDNINAYAFHALLGYNLKNLWGKPRLSLEYTYSSGDDDPDDGNHKTFDVGYGVWGAWYGGQWSLFKWRNFQDLETNLELWPTTGVKMIVGLHDYWLAEKEDAWYMNSSLYRSQGSNAGNHVGEALDVTFNIELNKIFPRSIFKGQHLSATYGHFFPGKVAHNRANEKGDANWFYIQWTYKGSWIIF